MLTRDAVWKKRTLCGGRGEGMGPGELLETSFTGSSSHAGSLSLPELVTYTLDPLNSITLAVKLAYEIGGYLQTAAFVESLGPCLFRGQNRKHLQAIEWIC